MIALPEPEQFVKEANGADRVGSVFLANVRAGPGIDTKRPRRMGLVSRPDMRRQRIRAVNGCLEIFLVQRKFVILEVGASEFANLVRFQVSHPIAAPAGFVTVTINRVRAAAINGIARIRTGIGNQGPGISHAGGTVHQHVVQHLPDPIHDHLVSAISIVEDGRVGKHGEQPRRIVRPGAALKERF